MDTSAENFAQAWNFLCHFQAPASADSRFDNLNQVDSDLDDIEDFVEADTNRDCYPLGELEQGLSIQRKQVRLCRHKLQTRVYPKLTKVKKVWRFPKHSLEPENQDLDHEWLQLVQP